MLMCKLDAVSTDVPRKFREALGSFGGILGTASIAINPFLAVGLVTAAGAGEASERAREGEPQRRTN